MKKKKLIFIMFIVCILILSSCQKNDNDTDSSSQDLNNKVTGKEADITTSDIFVTDVVYRETTLTDASKIVGDVTLKAAASDTNITIANAYTGTTETASVTTDGRTFTTPDDLLATLVVDGTQYDFTDFIDESIPADSKIIIYYTEDVYNLTNNGPGEGNGVYENFRMGLFFENGAIEKSASVLDAVTYSETENGLSDVAITSNGDNFNGILLKNTGTKENPYTIGNASISLTGNGGDDFQGWGSGIMITSTENNTSFVDITGSFITTDGAIRTAIWAGGSGTTNVNVSDTVVVGYDADENTDEYQDLKVPMMKKVPWALGLEGNNRITGVLGNALATYTDSIVAAEGWGALSTDSATNNDSGLTVNGVLSGIGSLEVYNEANAGNYTSTKEVNGVTYGFTVGQLGESSGYVTYADMGITNEYANSEFYAPDYIMIIAAGASGAVLDNITGETQRGGFMWHQTAGGQLTLNDGSYTVDDTMFLIKSQLSDTSGSNAAYTNIAVNNSEITIDGTNAQSGVLLQLMPTDDTAGSPVAGTYTVPYEGPDTEAATESIEAVNASFSNVSIEGDIYNSIQFKKQDLNVSFTDSEISGIISASYSYHVDENGTQYAEGDVLDDTMEKAYLYGGRILNIVSETVDNPVNLELTGTTWTVTGTSYLNSLTIDSESTINGTITINGTEMTTASIVTTRNGTITGNIVITEELTHH